MQTRYPRPRSSRAARLAALAGAVLISSSHALADDVDTSFEFFDVSGSFTLGDGPSVTFEGGEARSIGNFSLYVSGRNSWMISAGSTATITYNPPVASTTFFLRDQFASTNGTVVVRDPDGNLIGTPIDATTSFQQLTFTGDGTPKNPLIGSIEITAGGSSGFTVIDDFTSCVVPGGGGSPLPDPIPGTIPTGDVEIRLDTIASGMTAPNSAAIAPSLTDRIFVTDQTGVIWNINIQTGDRSAFHDVSSSLVPLGAFGPGTFDERGLLGLAFHPDYATPGEPGFGLFYTYESRPQAGPADFSTLTPGTSPNHQTAIVEYRAQNPLDPDAPANPTQSRVLLTIDQPQFNHNGGDMAFGPDAMLHISLGDGGASDDQGTGHSPGGNGQDPSNILGTIVRIDPLGTNSANGRYGIPGDNPFLSDPGTLDEILAFGFRNPFRLSFDSLTGDLYVADVGQNDIEEVNLVEPGQNHGWPIKEGTFLFDQNGSDPGFVFQNSPGSPAGLTDPIAQYDHDEGISVIGGFVYRGSRIPDLAGRYVFGEFGSTFSNDARLFHLDADNAVTEFPLQNPDALDISLLGFAQDHEGNLYALGNAPSSVGAPIGTTGVALRIDPACPADLTDPASPGSPDGIADANDFFFYLDLFASGDQRADLTDPADPGSPDGLIDANDFFFYLNLFAAGCP